MIPGPFPIRPAGGGSFDPHAPGPIGDDTPDSLAATQVTVNNGFQGVQMATGGFNFTGGTSLLGNESANTLILRNGTNGQTFILSGTFTDGANYSQLKLDATTGTIRFVADEAGSGAGHITAYSFDKPLTIPGYTVSTLPAGALGQVAYVTDATAPTFGGALTGGGTVKTLVFFNGTAWVSH